MIDKEEAKKEVLLNVYDDTQELVIKVNKVLEILDKLPVYNPTEEQDNKMLQHIEKAVNNKEQFDEDTELLKECYECIKNFSTYYINDEMRDCKNKLKERLGIE